MNVQTAQPSFDLPNSVSSQNVEANQQRNFGYYPMQSSDDNRKRNAIGNFIPGCQMAATPYRIHNFSSEMPIIIDNNLPTQQKPFFYGATLENF